MTKLLVDVCAKPNFKTQMQPNWYRDKLHVLGMYLLTLFVFQAAKKAIVRQCVCTGSPEPWPVACAINRKNTICHTFRGLIKRSRKLMLHEATLSIRFRSNK